jgi:hypothetical protein
MDEMLGVFTAINICRVTATFTKVWKNIQTGSELGRITSGSIMPNISFKSLKTNITTIFATRAIANYIY